MTPSDIEAIRQRVEKALADENSLAGAEITDIIALLAELDRRAELMRIAATALTLWSVFHEIDGTLECGLCCADLHDKKPHKPDCLIERLRGSE